MINKKINKPHSTEKAVECGLFWLWSDQDFSDIQQITVNFQCSVSVVCKYTFCKDFTKLYTLLVEAVQIPEEALEHDLVLKVCQKCTKGCRCKLLTDDNTGRTSALKVSYSGSHLFCRRRKLRSELQRLRRASAGWCCFRYLHLHQADSS